MFEGVQEAFEFINSSNGRVEQDDSRSQMSVGQRQSHITRMPDNSDVQSRYMQVAESYVQEKKAKLSESKAKKALRSKRNTIGNTADAAS